MANRWLCLASMLVPLFAADCGGGGPPKKEDAGMYLITKADYAAEDPNIPPGMKKIGANTYPCASLLGMSTADGKDYIYISTATKVSRYEGGHWSKPALSDFKSGMYMKIPADTPTFLTFPGQRNPYSIIMSSKPIPDSISPESNVAGYVNEAMLGIVSKIPGTESMVRDIADPIGAMKPDKRFSAYSCDGRVTNVEEMRYHRSEDKDPTNAPPYSENYLIGIRCTIDCGGTSHAIHHIFVSDNPELERLGTNIESFLNGKRAASSMKEIKKGMFVRYTTYSAQQDPTWVLFSDAEIPPTVHDPRIAN